MFFDQNASVSAPAAQSAAQRGAQSRQLRQRAALGLAVSLALPVWLGHTTAAQAADEPATAEAEAPQPSPHEVYLQARSQYRSGDWIAARKNFELAQSMGYKARLFEDSPAKYLAKMDAKEHADALKAEQEAQATPAQAASAAPAQPATTEPATAEAAATPATAPEAAPASTEPAAGPSDEAELHRTAMLEKIKREANAYKAQLKVQDARKALAEGKSDEALRDFSEAVELDPTNESARVGLNEVMRDTNAGGAAGLPEHVQTTVIARRGLIRYRFTEALNKAAKAIDDREFTEAETQINAASVARDSDPHVFQDSELGEFDAQIKSMQLRLEQARQQAIADARERANKTAEQAEEDRRVKQRQEREQTLADYIDEANQLIRDAQYQQALGVLDRIQAIDANNDYARGIRPLVNDKFILQQQRGYREDFDRHMERQLNSSEEHRIPYEDILRYPTDWPDISELRDASVKAERGVKDVDEVVANQLNRRLPEIKFDGNGFGDVVDFLRDVTGANIFVNWRALEAAGINKDAPVNARLKDVKFSKALSTILSDVGGGTVTLGYTIDEGVITISTADDLAKNTTTRSYDIRDLLVEIPDFTQVPNFDLTATATGGSAAGGGGGGGGGGGLFANATNGAEKTMPRQERVDAIIKLIQETVDPTSWRDAGGTVGSVRELAGTLIITQTSENQRQVVGLLEQLRETRAIQVSVEIRFVTVERHFLDDFATSNDLIVGAGGDLGTSALPNGGGVSGQSGQIGIIQQGASSSYIFTQGPIGGGLTPVPGSLSGAQVQSLGLAGTYLDHYQVNFLLRATQAETMRSIVNAPRVTLFNGQRAFVLVSEELAYVSNLTPVVAVGAAAFQPTIDVVQTGVLLDVQATVSSDRKYVTMTLRPQLASLIDLATFAFEEGEVGAAGVDSNGNPIEPPTSGILPGSGSGGVGVLQQPEIQLTEVRTTVSVPDGGTLLIGGQVLAAEGEREAGVPVLSKIPLIKRLFTNRSLAKDDFILLMLVKPDIIIQREAEQKQFPLLKEAGGS